MHATFITSYKKAIFLHLKKCIFHTAGLYKVAAERVTTPKIYSFSSFLNLNLNFDVEKKLMLCQLVIYRTSLIFQLP